MRYWDDRADLEGETALDAYVAASAYADAGLPVDYEEPALPIALNTADPVENLGHLCGLLADSVAAGRRAGQAVLLTGGNCSHAVGVAGGLQRAHGAGARIGVIWLDAHGDFNTPGTTISGGLFGMPLAVCAGLALPHWREPGGLTVPIPTDRIILVDARNLDAPEEQLVRATAVVVAAAAPGRPGADVRTAIADLASRCDLLYLHVDTDILDPAFMPSAHFSEPDGPNLDQVRAVIDSALATGKVAALAIVSVRNKGEGREISVASGVDLIRASLAAWRRYGMAGGPSND
jgi:arginase